MRYSRACFSLSFWVLFLTSAVASGQTPWSGIISPTRATDWTTAGVAIPSGNWTQYGSTIAPYGSSAAYASPSTINSALQSCSAAGNEYVLLGAGDFYLSGGIDFNSSGKPASNCELRGMGASQTRLHFSAGGGCHGWGANVCIDGSNTYSGGGYTQASWTGGYAQGATTITLSSVSGIVPNLTPIVLDACDSGLTGTAGSETCSGSPVDNGNLFVCQTSLVCISESSANTSRPNRGQEEVVVATSITGSGPYTVTISPGLRNPNWSALSTPQAWWGSQTITNAGVKDLMIDTTADKTSSIIMMTGYKVWAQGIASDSSNNYHIKAYITSHAVIRDSYAYWTADAAQQSYGLGGGINGDLLVENNIIQGVVDPLSQDASCSGCVFAYNFAVNQYDTTLAYEFPAASFHAVGESETLLEGNIGDDADFDDIHGTHFLDTQFRNYWNGYESNDGIMPTDDTSPVHLAAYSRYMNIIGNVLGTTGYHTTYACTPSSSSTSACAIGHFHNIFDLGWSGNTYGSLALGSPAAPNDTLTPTTLMRWGNYDVVTKAVRWCGGSNDTGWGTSCASASEVPTGDPYFPNSVPTVGDTGAGMSRFPSSFYNGATGQHSSCGTGLSYWKNPTTGTCPQYPPVGPDVTGGDIGMCTSGPYNWSRALTSAQCGGGTFTASANGGYGNSNPAMRCYLNQMNGAPDGTGSMLTFNRASCYASDPSTTTQAQPAPPLNVNGSAVPQ
jgi:hypothetical protein